MTTYTYNLEHLVDTLYDELDELMTGKKIVLSHPSVTILNKRTIVSNIIDLAKEVNRNYSQIENYFIKELNMAISQTAEGHMVIVGIVKQPHIEKHFKNYLVAFVQCKMCKSIDTYEKKEDRIIYLCCNKCKAVRAMK